MTDATDKTGMPVKQEIFLEAGVHIGTKIRTSDMREYIFKRRDDGLYILDLRKSAERLVSAAKIMAKYRPMANATSRLQIPTNLTAPELVFPLVIIPLPPLKGVRFV